LLTQVVLTKKRKIGKDHVTYFWNYGTPPYGEDVNKEFQVWHAYWQREVLIKIQI